MGKIKPLCPECKIEYLRTVYVRDQTGNRNARLLKVGMLCLNCGYHKLIEELEIRGYKAKKNVKCEKAQFTANLQKAYEEYLKDPTDLNLGRYEGIAKVAGFMELINREVNTAELEVHDKLKKERQAEE